MTAQINEQRIFLWDVTGSLLPQEKGVKDLGGHELPVYTQGNGKYVALQKAIVDAVSQINVDPMNRIVVVPFQDNPLEVWSEPATYEGKQSLIKKIKGFKYRSHKNTSIVDAMRKFESLSDPNFINYMFLYTDGKDDKPGTKDIFYSTVENWNPSNYGFYVLVDPEADIRDKLTKKPKNFWFVKDANVSIQLAKIANKTDVNVRDEKNAHIRVNVYTEEMRGKPVFTVNDPYYNVILTPNLSEGYINARVEPKEGIEIPEYHEVEVNVTSDNSNPYAFFAPETFSIQCINKAERTLKIEFK